MKYRLHGLEKPTHFELIINPDGPIVRSMCWEIRAINTVIARFAIRHEAENLCDSLNQNPATAYKHWFRFVLNNPETEKAVRGVVTVLPDLSMETNGKWNTLQCPPQWIDTIHVLLQGMPGVLELSWSK